jgi:glycine/D-amino acid oxidase-like deaminating enzyme
METSCDLIIIGGGQAGIPLAQDLAAMGKQIVLAERKYLGGSCVNFGCTPTKAAIASARLAHMSRRGGDFGIRIPTVDVDFGAVIQRAQKIALTSLEIIWTIRSRPRKTPSYCVVTLGWMGERMENFESEWEITSSLLTKLS